MKNLLLIILVFATVQLYSQHHFSSKQINMPETKFAPCQTEKELKEAAAITAATKNKWDAVKRANGIPVNNSTTAHPQFIWPMKISENYEMQYKYFVKGNFVDQNTGAGIRDFGCGSRTYDGHDASDISTFPFPWRMMDKMHVYAVAAAPGMIYFKEETGYDKECDGDGTPSNRIYLLHEDGSTSRYHHFKQYGVTSKDSGDMVEAGEFLGFIGSSGNSTNPHLHFAVYDNNGNNIEPFYLPGVSGNLCTTPFSTESWWQNQPAYWDAKINRIMTHSAEPETGTGCYSEEQVFAKNYFLPGDDFYTGIAVSESSASETVSCAVYFPNGTEFDSWTFSTNAFERRLYEVDGFSLPSDAPTGTWQVRATYRGNTYYHHFTVGCPGNLAPSGTVTGSKAYISGNTISSTVNHNTAAGHKLLYQAQNAIEFKPGFHAKTGVLLKTRFAGCNYSE